MKNNKLATPRIRTKYRKPLSLRCDIEHCNYETNEPIEMGKHMKIHYIARHTDTDIDNYSKAKTLAEIKDLEESPIFTRLKALKQHLKDMEPQPKPFTFTNGTNMDLTIHTNASNGF